MQTVTIRTSSPDAPASIDPDAITIERHGDIERATMAYTNRAHRPEWASFGRSYNYRDAATGRDMIVFDRKVAS